MKLYIILNTFYICNHSCDIHIFDVLYSIVCMYVSTHVKTFTFSRIFEFLSLPSIPYSSYMKDRQGGLGSSAHLHPLPPPTNATTPLKLPLIRM